MYVLLPCVLLAFLIPLAAKHYYDYDITWKEFMLQGVVQSLICIALYFGGMAGELKDVQVLNGEVVKKYHRQENCPSGWNDWPDSFCSNYRTRQVYTHTTCTGTGSSRSCIQHYKTQYNYDYDWEKRWYVTITFDTYEISRVNDRGDKEPNRWTTVKVGDPASVTKTYDNYLKAAQGNIINPDKKVAEYKSKVPTYPASIYDYYQNKKVLNSGVTIKELQIMDNLLRKELITLGRTKGLNIVVLFTDVTDPSYKFAVEEKWLGGKVNDIVVVVGTDGTNVIWADAITIGGNSGNELMSVKMRDELLAHKAIDTGLVGVITSVAKQYYTQKSMEDFKYLEEQLQPPNWLIITCYLLSLVLGCVFTLISIKHEII